MMIAMFLRPLKIMSSFTKDSYLLHCDSILFLSLSFYIFVVSKWSPSTNSASYAFSKSQLYLHIQNDSIFRGTKFGGVCCRFASLFFGYIICCMQVLFFEKSRLQPYLAFCTFFLHLLLPRSIGYSCFSPSLPTYSLFCIFWKAPMRVVICCLFSHRLWS